MGAVIGQGTHDGTRLFEFIVRPFDENPFFDTSFPSTIAALTGYGQAMMFVIFARQFIGLKEHYPIAFQFTNLYLIWYATHFFIFRLFNIELDLRLIWYPLILSTLLILLLIYYYAFRRYQVWHAISKILYYRDVTVFSISNIWSTRYFGNSATVCIPTR